MFLGSSTPLQHQIQPCSTSPGIRTHIGWDPQVGETMGAATAGPLGNSGQRDPLPPDPLATAAH